MGKALIKGCLFGGIVAFLWMLISWTVIPWHCAVLHGFEGEDIVANIITQTTGHDGIFTIPNSCGQNDTETAQTAAREQNTLIFTSISRSGFTLTGSIILSLITQWIGAFIITFLLLMNKNTSYFGRVVFVTLIGFLVGFLGHMPYWTWWRFSSGYIGLEILDLVIAWFLAGLVIAAVAKRPEYTH